MSTGDTFLHGSYFDLLREKYPDLAEPAPSPKPASRPRLRRRRRRSVVPAVLFATALAGVAWLAVELRPEISVPVPPAMRAGAVGAPPSPIADAGPAEIETVPAPALAEIETAPAPAPSETESVPAPRLASVQPTRPALLPSRAPVEERAAPPRPPEKTRAAAAPGHQPAAASPTSPRKVHSVPPEYPEAARLAGEEGRVVIAARVDASGAVTATDVVLGRSPALDQAAASALAQWRFEPATLDGEPVASTYRVSFDFALEPPSQADEASAEPAAPTPSAETPAVASHRAAAPLEVAGDVKPPLRITAPAPEYPDEAWAEGVTGDVLVRAVIDERGEVADVEVLKGLPFGMTEAALDAIRRWKFVPATLDGRPVAVYRNLSVRFET